MTEIKHIKITKKALGKLAGGAVITARDEYLDTTYEISVMSAEDEKIVAEIRKGKKHD